MSVFVFLSVFLFVWLNEPKINVAITMWVLG